MTPAAEPELEPEFDVVGTSLARQDGLPKTTGATRYADDLKLPRMAFCRLLRATRPHARILAVDTAAARALPGVLAVITGEDLPVKYGVLPVGQDEQALCTDKVRYVGDAVAAVAAVDEETADRALDLIQVDYAELPTYLSIEEGLSKAGEPIHAGRFGNAHRAASLEFGDVEERSARPTTSSKTRISFRAIRTCRSSSTPASPSGLQPASSPCGAVLSRRTTCTKS